MSPVIWQARRKTRQKTVCKDWRVRRRLHKALCGRRLSVQSVRANPPFLPVGLRDTNSEVFTRFERNAVNLRAVLNRVFQRLFIGFNRDALIVGR